VSYRQPLGRAPACRLLEEKGIKVVIVANLLSSESTGSPRAVQIFRRNMPCPHDIGMIGFLTVPRAKLTDK
jgi:hypothetical protein